MIWGNPIFGNLQIMRPMSFDAIFGVPLPMLQASFMMGPALHLPHMRARRSGPPLLSGAPSVAEVHFETKIGFSTVR